MSKVYLICRKTTFGLGKEPIAATLDAKSAEVLAHKTGNVVVEMATGYWINAKHQIMYLVRLGEKSQPETAKPAMTAKPAINFSGSTSGLKKFPALISSRELVLFADSPLDAIKKAEKFLNKPPAPAAKKGAAKKK